MRFKVIQLFGERELIQRMKNGVRWMVKPEWKGKSNTPEFKEAVSGYRSPLCHVSYPLQYCKLVILQGQEVFAGQLYAVTEIIDRQYILRDNVLTQSGIDILTMHGGVVVFDTEKQRYFFVIPPIVEYNSLLKKFVIVDGTHRYIFGQMIGVKTTCLCIGGLDLYRAESVSVKRVQLYATRADLYNAVASHGDGIKLSRINNFDYLTLDVFGSKGTRAHKG